MAQSYESISPGETMTDTLAEWLEKAKQFFIHGGGGHEDGEAGARAVTFSFEGMCEMAVAFAEYVMQAEIAAAKVDGAREEYLLWIQGMKGELEPTHRVAVDLARHDAAVRERTLEELISECHRYPVMCMVEGWLISKRDLKTPQPEVSDAG